MKIIILFLTLFISIAGCSKMQDKKTAEENKIPDKQSTNSPGTNNGTTNQKTQTQKDEKASELVKAADEAIAMYAGNKTDGNKKEVLAACLEAANYLMLEANLPAKEKYRPALRYYRKVLELEPNNEQAAANKKQIEDIYQSMGMPVPE